MHPYNNNKLPGNNIKIINFWANFKEIPFLFYCHSAIPIGLRTDPLDIVWLIKKKETKKLYNSKCRIYGAIYEGAKNIISALR